MFHQTGEQIKNICYIVMNENNGFSIFFCQFLAMKMNIALHLILFQRGEIHMCKILLNAIDMYEQKTCE